MSPCRIETPRDVGHNSPDVQTSRTIDPNLSIYPRHSLGFSCSLIIMHIGTCDPHDDW